MTAVLAKTNQRWWFPRKRLNCASASRSAGQLRYLQMTADECPVADSGTTAVGFKTSAAACYVGTVLKAKQKLDALEPRWHAPCYRKTATLRCARRAEVQQERCSRS